MWAAAGRAGSSRRSRAPWACDCHASTASGVAGADQSRGLLEPGDGPVDLGGKRVGVGGEDVPPDDRVRTRHARGVAKASADLGQALALVGDRDFGLRDQHVRDHVGQVAHGRHQPVVELGVDRLRAGAHLGDRALEPVVVDAPGLPSRRQVPASALEELGSGVLDPGSLGAGDRMPADEAAGGRMAGEAIDEILLGRADVGDDGVSPLASSASATSSGRWPTGAAQKTRSAPATASATVSAPDGERASLKRRPQRASARVEADHLGPRRRWAASPIEPPIRPTPQTATLIGRPT